MSYLFHDTGIQFLALNSAWQIDQFHRKRSSIYSQSLTAALERADSQIAVARDTCDLKKLQPTLRFAVWHHALEGVEALQNDDFLTHIGAARVRICLHGDVHESRRKWVNYWDRGGIHILGAGTFGAPEEGRSESTPRLYNLLEIQRDLSAARVHTRQQQKSEGAWQGWYVWPNPDGGKGRVPYFDIQLT